MRCESINFFYFIFYLNNITKIKQTLSGIYNGKPIKLYSCVNRGACDFFFGNQILSIIGVPNSVPISGIYVTCCLSSNCNSGSEKINNNKYVLIMVIFLLFILNVFDF